MSFLKASDLGLNANKTDLNKLNQDVKTAKNLAVLKEKSDDFEAIVLKTLLDISLKEPKQSIFGKSVGSGIYRSMYHDSLSKQLAGGFGYSELLFEFLKKNV